jgi:predicted TIM-barrel fold metal-dependent hydrolase
MTTITQHRPDTLPAIVVDTGIVDADIHPVPLDGALDPYLDERWQKHWQAYGVRNTTGLQYITEYPQMYGGAMRADSWPEEGYPGSDRDLLISQLLDKHNIQLGVLQCLAPGGQTLNPAAQAVNQDLAAALCGATNDWQLNHLVYHDPRMRAAVTVTFESPAYAIEEIQRHAGNPGVVAVLGTSKTLEPLGSKKYWPIYEACEAAGLPLQLHLSQGGGHANTGTGWTSYHTEYHTGHVQSFQSQLLSLVLSGTFDRFPSLKVMFVEGNVVHFAPLVQRMDYTWETCRQELPDLQRKPSEYIRDHIWASTQPIDEPEKPEHLAELIEEFCADNVVFATDYPHFDFDAPETAFPHNFPEALKEKILRTNGKKFFGVMDEVE